MKTKSILITILALIMSLTVLVGCNSTTEASETGVLYLSVNPEIAVHYDKDGNVTKIIGQNDDGKKILVDYNDFNGKSVREVMTKLVTAIGAAGYFIEEIEGESRQITIEIEKGSKLPHDKFLDEIFSDIRSIVQTNNWKSPVAISGNSDYGISDYLDSDYGPQNDGVTDYDDSDYGPNNDGVTDYDDSDYGPNNDGVTDYDDSDYKETIKVTPSKNTNNNNSKNNSTDYDDSDYGPNNDGVTDYNDSDYKKPTTTPTTTAKPSNTSKNDSDYDDSDYKETTTTVKPSSNSKDDSDYDDSDYN